MSTSPLYQKSVVHGAVGDAIVSLEMKHNRTEQRKLNKLNQQNSIQGVDLKNDLKIGVVGLLLTQCFGKCFFRTFRNAFPGA